MPSSACLILLRPSNVKGLVTTPTVRAPISLDNCAIIGAPPVPVPPPIPAVINTISAPSNTLAIFSLSSSTALRPISGLDPLPNPLVILLPICIFCSALENANTCASVLVDIYLTPCNFASIILFTAFPPPPPIPITLILTNCPTLLFGLNNLRPPYDCLYSLLI